VLGAPVPVGDPVSFNDWARRVGVLCGASLGESVGLGVVVIGLGVGGALVVLLL
jgi:hypothetical protein